MLQPHTHRLLGCTTGGPESTLHPHSHPDTDVTPSILQPRGHTCSFPRLISEGYPLTHHQGMPGCGFLISFSIRPTLPLKYSPAHFESLTPFSRSLSAHSPPCSHCSPLLMSTQKPSCRTGSRPCCTLASRLPGLLRASSKLCLLAQSAISPTWLTAPGRLAGGLLRHLPPPQRASRKAGH